MSAPRAVLITGAARGIGRALCAEALGRGYRVHALVRKPGSALPGTVEHVGDIRDRAAFGKLLGELAPGLDLYIANAGVGHRLSLRKPESPELAAEMMEINGTATIYSAYVLAQAWMQAPRPGRRMAIVSSLSAGRGLPRNSVYAASKTAELTFCDGFAEDAAEQGIGVTVILPGFIETEMSAGNPNRPFLLTAEQAARRMFDGIERGKRRIAFPAPTAFLSWVVNRMPLFVFRGLVALLKRAKAF